MTRKERYDSHIKSYSLEIKKQKLNSDLNQLRGDLEKGVLPNSYKLGVAGTAACVTYCALGGELLENSENSMPTAFYLFCSLFFTYGMAKIQGWVKRDMDKINSELEEIALKQDTLRVS